MARLCLSVKAMFWRIVPEDCIMMSEKPLSRWNKISEESVGSEGLAKGWWPLPASMGGLRSVCQGCGAELQTHRQAHTFLWCRSVSFDAVETSSADTGLLALPLWIEGGQKFYSWLCFCLRVLTGVYKTNPTKRYPWVYKMVPSGEITECLSVLNVIIRLVFRKLV